MRLWYRLIQWTSSDLTTGISERKMFTIRDFHQFQALLQFLIRITCHLVVVVQMVHASPDRNFSLGCLYKPSTNRFSIVIGKEPWTTFVLPVLENFRSDKPKQAYYLRSERNFRNLLVNSEQPGSFNIRHKYYSELAQSYVSLMMTRLFSFCSRTPFA